MLIAETTLEMVWGTREQWTINCTLDGTPFDITNFDLFLTVKAQPTDADPGVFQLTNIANVDNGITKVDPVNGGALATVLPVATRTQPYAELYYRWDLWAIASNDPTNAVVVARGPFLIHPAQTRSL